MASHLTPVEEPQSMLALPLVLLPLPETVTVCPAAACKPQAKATACHSATTKTRWQTLAVATPLPGCGINMYERCQRAAQRCVYQTFETCAGFRPGQLPA